MDLDTNIFEYNEDDCKITITGLQKDVAKTSIVIPDTIGGLPVTELAYKAFSGSLITNVKMGGNIIKIGAEAFSHCHKLRSVIWNCPCEEIPETCFCNCVVLEQFDFSNIKYIRWRAFNASGLKKVHLPPNVKEVESAAFSSCMHLQEVIWDSDCKEIPTDCFYECSSLKEFNFSNIEIINSAAFSKSGLQKICLPENIKAVSMSAFRNCEKLRSVDWYCTCNEIPKFCFCKCSNLKQFDFYGVKKIDSGAFMCSGINNIYLHSYIEEIKDGVFTDCTELKKIIWNCNCDNISDFCFQGCSALEEFTFSGINKLGNEAFEGSGLKAVFISSEMQVGKRCFAHCDNLTVVTWLSDKDIEGGTFANCKALKDALISDKVKNIASSAFFGCSNVEINFV